MQCFVATGVFDIGEDVTIRKQKQFKPLEDKKDSVKKWHYILQKVLRTDDVTDFAYTPHPLTDDNVCKKFANNIYCIKSTAAQEQTVKVWSIQLWRIHHKRHGGAFFWGWCVNFVPSKKLCAAVCPEKPHTCPRRRTQRSDQGSHTERPGEFLAALESVQIVTKVAKKTRKGPTLRFLTPNAKESMEPSWRSGTLAVYQVPQKNFHNGRISIMIIINLH